MVRGWGWAIWYSTTGYWFYNKTCFLLGGGEAYIVVVWVHKLPYALGGEEVLVDRGLPGVSCSTSRIVNSFGSGFG